MSIPDSDIVHSSPPRALLFDVFGTCVDWRSTVTNALLQAAQTALASASSSVASKTRLRVSDMTIEDWGAFAQDWRNSYKKFTKAIANDSTLPYKSVDEHHHDSLNDLLISWQLEGLWNTEEVQAISLIWHRLNPWTDAENGIKALNTLYRTCTLSNGNIGLVTDLKAHAKLEFTDLFSAEEFGTFKPNPKVYLGAAVKLGTSPQECVMIAAHLADLEAAKSCGFQTVYVERPLEEDWPPERIESAKTSGIVDFWISVEENGFISVAEKLGVVLHR
ncbi:haloacid dehalogenase [Tothia fuscella]|uniref:Haloacid dehalogenase n=1 Tax=Tothia fuscella TaxID=1048955 RepID=A0A9P4TT60_9PEZI|nr:haloacid dehalogenase [Tothia fuscella]